MKTTIKLSSSKSLTVEPCRQSDSVCLNILEKIAVAGGPVETVRESIYLTPDQVGALLVALEFAGGETPAAAMSRNFESECM